MTRTSRVGCSLFVVLGLSAGTMACGNAKPPSTATDVAPPAPSTASVAVTPPSTGDSVVIDQAVLAKCGIASTEQAPQFAFNSADLVDQGRSMLDTLAQCMLDGPLRGKRLQLVGRADPRGEDEYNMALGSSRAEAVASYLHDRGVPLEQLSLTSRGKLDARGTDEQGWALDRRVDVALRPSS